MIMYPLTEIKNSFDLILTPLLPIFLAQINGIQNTLMNTPTFWHLWDRKYIS